MNIELKKQMPTPEEVHAMYPLSEKSRERKALMDAEIRSIIGGGSDKLLLVIGPCSADREDAVLDYIS
ncbi:MAG: 3-deoxy-7-phosphoheptulonate synthase, partial [Parasporobacterium sp.]|nr:3-deoxy-7-phosphoheptulonate synthase [Parasporobacterium sp.]